MNKSDESEGAATVMPAAPDLSDVPFLIYFDDTEQKPRIVVGETGARATFARVSDNWNAHLFVKIASNTRDDTYASKNAGLAALRPTAEPRETVAYQRDLGHGAKLSYSNEVEGSFGTRELVYKTEADRGRPSPTSSAPACSNPLTPCERDDCWLQGKCLASSVPPEQQPKGETT